jgi:hypothetical protein
MYVGGGVLVPVLVAALAPHQKRERALCWTGGAAVVLALGTFHQFAPWNLLHELPIYKSLHVPSRWLYPAALFFGVLVAAVGERWLGKLERSRSALELGMLAAVTALALDVSGQAAHSMKSAFWMQIKELPRFQIWKQHARVPPELHYVRRDYGPPAVPAMLARAGVVECGTLHFDLGVWGPKGKNRRSVGQGARGHEEPDYRGEAFTLSGTGQAKIVDFTPNRVTVEFSGARASDTLVLNQNFAEGWRANGQPAFSHDDRLATRLESASGSVSFAYRPPRLWPGLGVAAVAVVLLVLIRRRYGSARAQPPPGESG